MEDCFISGKSTQNERTESWWNELEKSQLYRWRVSRDLLVFFIVGNIKCKTITPLFPKIISTSCNMHVRTTNLSRCFQNYFQELAHTGGYNSHNAWDRIALLALYMQRIRDEVYGFMDLWNIHPIRKDKFRPNAVSGKPFRLYKKPQGGAQRWGRPVDLDLCSDVLKDCEAWGK
jgi:hypothetical protein